MPVAATPPADAPPADPEAFSPGTLVRARGRDWLVMPVPPTAAGNPLGLLFLRPVGGTDDEATAVHPGVEPVEASTFDPPDPAFPGDANACRLLRDAARLSTRASVGPFRSFSRIAVAPRPYQLVPLLMALRQETVRLLLADDVGIGKTIEAGLIAREMLDRGEVPGFCVLCPPHLADQWRRELLEKFHLDAAVVLPGTIRKLEGELRQDESVYERHAVTIVSQDFVKSDRRREDFLRACPPLVIVDEAHGCSLGDETGRARQARHRLVHALAADADRHLVLVTATPHSGNPHAFRSLLALLDPALATAAEADTEASRRRLARHLVQRRRGDIVEFLDDRTAFPIREEKEVTYDLTAAQRSFFDDVLAFTREAVAEDGLTKRTQRVRWWSALGLLRAIGSSPAAAAATLRNRAGNADAADAADAASDPIGPADVLDHEPDEEHLFGVDLTPSPAFGEANTTAARLAAFADRAEASADDDPKLAVLVAELEALLAADPPFHPVVFCRFIPTAEYVAAALRERLKKCEVAAVTGLLPPEEREKAIDELGGHPRRVLVCTDCLSEGINLQDRFDAVVHYDLAWNPTRLEQREGRVDRFGQRRPTVRVITLFGADNPIDGIVLDVLLRKHHQIRADLGVSVAAPADGEKVIDAIFRGLMLREGGSVTPADRRQLVLDGMEETLRPHRDALHEDWERAAEREKASRSRYAQHAIGTEEVAAELAAAQDAIGSDAIARRFFLDALTAAGVTVATPGSDERGIAPAIEATFDASTDRGLRDALGVEIGERILGRFEPPAAEDEQLLGRTHPLVERLAAHVLESALDPHATDEGRSIARRCGVIVTDAVAERTTVLLVRLRHRLSTRFRTRRHLTLAEEVIAVAFHGHADVEALAFLPEQDTLPLLDASPAANRPDAFVTQQLKRLMDRLPALTGPLTGLAAERARRLDDQHRRVRQSGGRAGDRGTVTVTPLPPPDVLGAFLYLPARS